jgi:dihydroorotate dehydrogenase
MDAFYSKVIRPALFSLDAERAHELAKRSLRKACSLGTLRDLISARYSAPSLPVERFGLRFLNPLGVAAGFDKDAELFEELGLMGFGSVEVGTVTHLPQRGNPRPRLFRLPLDDALINRMGFNNEGAEKAAERLRQARSGWLVIGVNIGRNREVETRDAAASYLSCFETVQPVADYIAVNVSSPNTPGLRELQSVEHLNELLRSLQKRNKELGPKPLLVKVSPDLEERQIEEIVAACGRHEVAGIIATNTTTSRERLRTPAGELDRIGTGGLSGRPLAAASDHVIARIYRASNGAIPIVGVGGIFSGDDAFRKIRAGACLIQSYTGFVYGGPRFARQVLSRLSELLEQNGFRSVDEAVGSGANAADHGLEAAD